MLSFKSGQFQPFSCHKCLVDVASSAGRNIHISQSLYINNRPPIKPLVLYYNPISRITTSNIWKGRAPHLCQWIGGVKQNLRLRLIKWMRWPHKTWLIAQSGLNFEQIQSGHTIEKFWLRSEHGCDLHILTPAYNRVGSTTSITAYYKSRAINQKVPIAIKIPDAIELINSIV